MAHFAEIDDAGTVLRVIVIANASIVDADGVEQESIGQEFCKQLFGGNWLQTSYNANFRGKFASVGYKYDVALDEFVAPEGLDEMDLVTSDSAISDTLNNSFINTNSPTI